MLLLEISIKYSFKKYVQVLLDGFRLTEKPYWKKNPRLTSNRYFTLRLWCGEKVNQNYRLLYRNMHFGTVTYHEHPCGRLDASNFPIIVFE